MDQEIIRRLDEIGFDFSPKEKANEDIWNLHFRKLHEYSEIHGHCECFVLSTVIPSS
jgi:hypothetical protein